MTSSGTTFFDAWEFFGRRNDRIQIDLVQTSGVFDLFLLLLRPDNSTAATDIESTLRVIDRPTAQAKDYVNPLGQAANAVTDTGAFATCP